MSTHNSRKAREAAREAERTAARERREWFVPTRFGIGTGLPIRWQGWLTYALYLGVIGGVALLDRQGSDGTRIAAFALFVSATASLLAITARHTRGGWKWRWGTRD